MSAADKKTQERAPLLLVFGPLVNRVAKILRAHPSLTFEVVCVPPKAIYATDSFLYLARCADGR
jgi:hypothetical protein